MTNLRRIDFGGRGWTAHAQDHWLEHAGNPGFPDHLRIVFVAYGRHRANGHARMSRGELARFLVRRDGTLPERRVVWTALQKAIALEFLMPESQALCLVVSSEHVQGGVGDPDRPCPRDHTKRTRTKAETARDEQGRMARTSVKSTDTRPRTSVESRDVPDRTSVKSTDVPGSGPLSSPTAFHHVEEAS